MFRVTKNCTKHKFQKIITNSSQQKLYEFNKFNNLKQFSNNSKTAKMCTLASIKAFKILFPA